MCAATETLTVWDAGAPDDYAAWLGAWERWPGREVFAHPGYVRLALGNGERALGVHWVSHGVEVLFPFVLRDLRAHAGWHSALGAAHDVTTPYGYGGAFWWGGGDRAAAAAEFWPAYDAWASDVGVVSEFVRLTLFDDQTAPYPGERRVRGPNVVRSLALDDDALWTDYEHKVRKNVKRARAGGLAVAVDRDGASLDAFVDVYLGTMRRRTAAASYHFPRRYFEALVRDLRGHFAFFHTVHEGRAVSTEVVLVSADYTYSFLGGTEESAFSLRPNDLLKHEIIRWSRAAGKRAYVLGGGAEPADGIYRYKLAFAPGGAVPFHAGARVLRPEAFAALERARDAERTDVQRAHVARVGPFPSYRF